MALHCYQDGAIVSFSSLVEVLIQLSCQQAMCQYRFLVQRTILSTPRLISSSCWLACVWMCVCERECILSLLGVVHVCFHFFFSGSLPHAPTTRPLQRSKSQHRGCYVTFNREQELNVKITLTVLI